MTQENTGCRWRIYAICWLLLLSCCWYWSKVDKNFSFYVIVKKYLVFQKLDVFKWISRFPVFLAKLQKYVALKIRSGACLPALFWYGLNEQPKAERVYNGRINVNGMSSPDVWLIFVLRRRKQKREWSSSPSPRSSICSWWGSCTTHRPTKTSRSMTGKEKNKLML